MNLKLKNMRNELIEKLYHLADRYESKEFIKNDPVQFCHKYIDKQDCEIIGFIASWLSYGSRLQFIPIIDYIRIDIMNDMPYEYIISRRWMQLYRCNDVLYRFCTMNDLFEVCNVLYDIYNNHVDMESSMLKTELNPMSFLAVLFGHITQMPDIKSNSACKKYAMFLRWMVRQNSPVDIGIWESISPSKLIVPVDTHVMQSSKELGLINKSNKSITYKDAMVLTCVGNEIFPNDPARLDFALYGYGIDKNK